MRKQASDSGLQFITISENPLLPPRLLCSVKIGGNTHQVYYEFDGNVASIVSQIELNDTAYFTTVFITEDTAYFTSVRRNGVVANVTLSQVKALWPLINEGLSCAERSYTPAIQNELERSDSISEIVNPETLDDKIRSLDIKSFKLKIAYRRLAGFIYKVKKYHPSITTSNMLQYQSDFNHLMNDYDVVIKCINKLLKSQNLNADQIDRLNQNLNLTVAEKNEIITISGFLTDIFSSRTTKDIDIFFIVKKDREANELIYQFSDDGSHIRFNHSGIAVSMTLKLTYSDSSYDCTIETSIDSETQQRVDQISISPHTFLSLEMEAGVHSLLKRLYSKRQLAYSPLPHEELDQGDGPLISDNADLTNLIKLFHRVKYYDAYLSHPDLRYQSKAAETHCQNLASYYFDILKHRYNHMRNQVDQDDMMSPDLKTQIKSALIALKVEYDQYHLEKIELVKNQLSRAVTEWTDAQEQAQAQTENEVEKKIAFDKAIQELNEARNDLLALEESESAGKSKKVKKTSASKPPQKKSEPIQRKKPPENKPSSVEIKFQNKFNELNKLMEQTLIYLRKNSSSPSQEIKNQIGRIEKMWSDIQDFFNNNNLAIIERRHNQLGRLNQYWLEIQTCVSAAQSTAEAAPLPVFPIDAQADSPSVSSEPTSPVAEEEATRSISLFTVSAEPRFFSRPLRGDRKVGIHDPYSAPVIDATYMEYSAS